MNNQEDLIHRVKTGQPGAYLWRTRANADGTHEEELLSENSVFRVVDCNLYLKPVSQPTRHFSHSELEEMEEAYLLVCYKKTAEPEIQFAFWGTGLDYSGEDVERASISIVIEGPQDKLGTVLSFVLWSEDGAMHGSFLGGSQQRLIRHLYAIHQLLGAREGETHV